MSSPKTWIFLLATISFCAGGVSWALVREVSKDSQALKPVFSQYEKRFLQDFQLNADQRKLLHKILLAYQEEEENVKNRHVSAMEPELREAGRQAERRLRNLLTEEQLSHYERLLEQGKQEFPEPDKQKK